mmetsp:Transcript_10473/g.39558  ORF Transcript_10473/g.39558 Transcript_10473/m.39558 type:complete len:208 (-) Transcript_10473:49-672(-)
MRRADVGQHVQHDQATCGLIPQRVEVFRHLDLLIASDLLHDAKIVKQRQNSEVQSFQKENSTEKRLLKIVFAVVFLVAGHVHHQTFHGKIGCNRDHRSSEHEHRSHSFGLLILLAEAVVLSFMVRESIAVAVDYLRVLLCCVASVVFGELAEVVRTDVVSTLNHSFLLIDSGRHSDHETDKQGQESNRHGKGLATRAGRQRVFKVLP